MSAYGSSGSIAVAGSLLRICDVLVAARLLDADADGRDGRLCGAGSPPAPEREGPGVAARPLTTYVLAVIRWR